MVRQSSDSVRHLEDAPTPTMAGLGRAMRRLHLREREALTDERLQVAIDHERGQLIEDRTDGWRRLHPGGADAVLLCPFRLWHPRRRDENASLSEDAPRPLGDVAPDGVENHINIVDAVLETGGRVVDNLVRAQGTNEVDVARRGGGDDVGALLATQLDRQATHPAGAAVDQQALTTLKARGLKEPPPGGATADGQGRSLLEAQGLRLSGNRLRQGGGIFGVGALAAAEHLVADSEAGRVRAHLGHGAGEVQPEDGGRSRGMKARSWPERNFQSKGFTPAARTCTSTSPSPR